MDTYMFSDNQARIPNMKGTEYMDNLVQGCNVSIANALEILQYCTKLVCSDMIGECFIY